MKIFRYRIHIFKLLVPYVSQVKKWFLGNTACYLALKFMAMLPPLFYGLFIEKVIVAKNISFMLPVAAGYLLVQLGISGVKLLNSVCSYKVKNSVTKNMKEKLMGNYLSLDFGEYSSVTTGNVKMVMEDDVEKLSSFTGRQSIEYVVNVIYVFVYLFLMLKIDWKMTLLACVTIPVTLILDHIVSSREKNVNDILNRNDASWATWLDESIKGFKEIRVNQMSNLHEKEFMGFQDTDETYFSTWLRFWVTRTLVIPKIKDDFFMKFALYFLGGILIYHRYFTIGVLLIFVQYYSLLADTVKFVSQAGAELQSNMPYIDCVIEKLECERLECGKLECGKLDCRKSEIEFNAQGKAGEKPAACLLAAAGKKPCVRDIVMKDIVYGYDEKNILSGFHLSVRAGERIGIQGDSGTGKSTLIKLLLGIVSPKEGQVLYGGSDLTEIDKHYLYGKIAYIGQESMLFNTTVKENLLMGNPDAGMEEMANACRRADIHDLIASLPEQYETELNEEGSRLSGGEKQRLLLARAFLRNPDVYIFDEVTSALDGLTESKIIKSIRDIARDKTIIIVSHQAEVFQLCDRVIRL